MTLRIHRLRRRGRLGFSLIEVMAASAILPLGLIASFYLLGRSAQVGRDAELSLSAIAYGSQLVTQYEAMGYAGVDTGTFTVNHPSEPRIKPSTVVVAKDGTAKTATIEVTVTWNDSNQKLQTRVFNGVVSEPPPP